MFKKVVVLLLLMLAFVIGFLWTETKQLKQKQMELIAICNSKSITHFYALKHQKYDALEASLAADIDDFVRQYDKRLYLSNRVLQKICNDIEIIQTATKGDKKIFHNIEKIKRDCSEVSKGEK